jgi:hypothetical protein
MEEAGSSEMSVSTYRCIRYQNRKDRHQQNIHREILTTYLVSISSDGDTGSGTDRHDFYVRRVFIVLLRRPTPDNETKLEVPWLHDPLSLSCLLLILYTRSLKYILWHVHRMTFWERLPHDWWPFPFSYAMSDAIIVTEWMILMTSYCY